jgi:hypothetical protein
MPRLIPWSHSAIRNHYSPHTLHFLILFSLHLYVSEYSNQISPSSWALHALRGLFYRLITIRCPVVQWSPTDCGVSGCDRGTSTAACLNPPGLLSKKNSLSANYWDPDCVLFSVLSFLCYFVKAKILVSNFVFSHPSFYHMPLLQQLDSMAFRWLV